MKQPSVLSRLARKSATAKAATRSFTQIGIAAILVLLASLITPGATWAQQQQPCAWPIELSPEGFGNATTPDTAARYWVVPFDGYQTMTIKGTYPDARYFSIVAYNTNSDKNVVSIAGSLYDVNIHPDPGSINPFAKPGSKSGTYTVVISRSGRSSNNTIAVSSEFAWVLLRVYVPDASTSLSGRSLMGGVPLPTITVTGNGGTQQLQTCQGINALGDVNTLLQALFPIERLNPDEGTPSSDRLWFAPPANPPLSLIPNPNNKYLAMFPGNEYQPGRIIVIHGKAPGFPDTFHGSSLWSPAPGFRKVDLRYWSLCEADFVLPVPTVNCAVDFTTKLTGGYYTVVVSDDLVRPDWLKSNVNWLPWGDEQYSKVLFFRNMLPSPNFHHAVQDAVTEGCTVDLQFPNIPPPSEVETAGQCAQKVMGDYYPVAVWCDKSTFMAGGLQACLKKSRKAGTE